MSEKTRVAAVVFAEPLIICVSDGCESGGLLYCRVTVISLV